MAAPADVDLLLAGGRGGGKSMGLLFLALQHLEIYGDRARILFLRQRHGGAEDFLAMARRLFAQVYDSRVRFNSNTRQWSGLPGSFEVNQLDNPAEFAPKLQGKSYTLFLWDECGEAFDEALFSRVLTCLRGPEGVPTRVALACNPGGRAHTEIVQIFLSKADPWRIFREERSGRDWLVAPSTVDDNEHVNRKAYESMLGSLKRTDNALYQASRWGDWNIVAGGFFSDCIGESRVAFPSDLFPVDFFQQARFAEVDQDPLYYAIDWEVPRFTLDVGFIAPSDGLLFTISPGAMVGDFYFPRGSFIFLDECALVDDDNIARGLELTTPEIAERMQAMCERWGVPPQGVIDDAVYARHGSERGSIAEELERYGLDLEPARKGRRIAGWQRMRTLLSAAGRVDVPGLYVSRRCWFWWATVPFLPRDPRRPDDVHTGANDHAADATRYALGEEGSHVGSMQHVHE